MAIKYLKISKLYSNIAKTKWEERHEENRRFINSINLNAGTDFPYLVWKS